jgi:rRNA processing protein Gar1
MRPPKRRTDGDQRQHHGRDEDLMDDLAVAASYATATAPPAAPTETEPASDHDDPDEINVDGSDDDDDDDGDKEASTEPTANENDSNGDVPVSEKKDIEGEVDANDDDDDDESDVDFAEELARMEETEGGLAGDDDEDGRGGGNQPACTTAHEVDAYQTNALKALETATGLNLTVQPEDLLEEDRTLASSRLSPAGRAQHHMVDDRILIIQSQIGVVLEEGTLLVLQQKNNLVPLGKIFEVFGPVSQPLYSIRLPEELPEHAGEDEKKADKATDTTEASTSNNGDSPPKTTKRVDPWSKDGEYTQLLKESANLPVYCIQNKAALVDTAFILRQSGRGCDASNVYDEEVQNTNEMYFSDDEKERDAKSSRGKKKGREDRQHKEQGSRHHGQPPSSNSNPTPHGFHTGPTSAPPSSYPPGGAGPPGYPQGYQQGPPQAYQQGYQQGPQYGYHQGPLQGYQQGPPQGYYQGPPQGYHQGPPQGGYQQGPPHGYAPYYAGMPPNQGVAPGYPAATVPPPPPPGATFAYAYPTTGAPPPPPPKDNSDTVYYDYS